MNYVRPAIIGLLALAALVALAALLLGGSPTAYAATFTVTKTADTADGICDADCSLREAIGAANALPGSDTIVVPAGTYTLTIAGAGEDANTGGDLDITADVTINGVGAPTTIIDGNAGATGDRVFHLLAGAAVEMTGLSVVGGGASLGGGILNEGNLTLNGSSVSGNAAIDVFGDGGGIYNGINGTLTLSSSSVSGNTAVEAGGGIVNHGDAAFTNSTVSGNAGPFGGGIVNVGTLTLNSSSVSGNTGSDSGGGIFNFGGGTLTLTDSTVSGNTAGDDGGGINNFGTATLTDSTVSGNTATSSGGGIFNQGGTLMLANSTISGNTAVDGGGIRSAFGGMVALSNSTISGNAAFTHGGGIYTKEATTSLNNVTIADNVADSDDNGSGDGGGVANFGGTTQLKNTIIARNTDVGGERPDCGDSVNSQGYNLIQDTLGCIINGDITGNITGQDPLLGPLQDNGGPTFTHALPPGSPAIDAGSGDCPPPATDQRGVARPQGAACDIGAYEFAPDADSDGVPDASDNCPSWPNADHSLPPWPVTLDGSDPDCDGTTTALEDFLGTNPNLACGVNAWPPDTTDNGTVNAGDIGIIVDSWQKSSGEQGYIQRADLNGNGTVNAGDLGPIAETWQQSCT